MIGAFIVACAVLGAWAVALGWRAPTEEQQDAWMDRALLFMVATMIMVAILEASK